MRVYIRKPIYDNDHINVATPISPEMATRSDLAAEEESTIPGTKRETSPYLSTLAGRSCDGTDTAHHKEPDADTSVEQPYSTPTDPGSTKYEPCHNPKPNCNEDYGCKILFRRTIVYGAHRYTFRKS